MKEVEAGQRGQSHLFGVPNPFATWGLWESPGSRVSVGGVEPGAEGHTGSRVMLGVWSVQEAV